MTNPFDPQPPSDSNAEDAQASALNDALNRANEPVETPESTFASWFNAQQDEARDEPEPTPAPAVAEEVAPVVAEEPVALEETTLATAAMPTSEPVPAAQNAPADEVSMLAGAAAVGVAGAAGVAATTPPPMMNVTGEAPVYSEAAAAETLLHTTTIPPKPAGNRWFASLVGLIGTVIFAGLYIGLTYMVAVSSDVAFSAMQFVSSPAFYVPVASFFVGFAILGVVLNRAAWWAWAVFGVFVGLFTYLGYIVGLLVETRAWEETASAALATVSQNWLHLEAVLVFVFARDIPVWLGGWIARRGRKVTEAHEKDMAEYYESHPAANAAAAEADALATNA